MTKKTGYPPKYKKHTLPPKPKMPRGKMKAKEYPPKYKVYSRPRRRRKAVT